MTLGDFGYAALKLILESRKYGTRESRTVNIASISENTLVEIVLEIIEEVLHSQARGQGSSV